MNFGHDKFCEYHGETMYDTRPCTCEYLARVRADERKQATAAKVLAEYASAFGQDHARFTYSNYYVAFDGERTVEGDMTLISNWATSPTGTPSLQAMREQLELCPVGGGHYSSWCNYKCQEQP